MRLPKKLTAITDEQRKRFDDYVWMAEEAAKVYCRRCRRRDLDFKGDMYSAALHGLLAAATEYRDDEPRTFWFAARPKVMSAMRKRQYENLADEPYWENYQKRKDFIKSEWRLGVEGPAIMASRPDHRRTGIDEVDDRDEISVILSSLKSRDHMYLRQHYLEGKKAYKIADEIGIYPTYGSECLGRALKAARAFVAERRAV